MPMLPDLFEAGSGAIIRSLEVLAREGALWTGSHFMQALLTSWHRRGRSPSVAGQWRDLQGAQVWLAPRLFIHVFILYV